jgi:uncharacterized protein
MTTAMRQQVTVQKGGRIEVLSSLPEGARVEVVVSPLKAPLSLDKLREQREGILAIAAKYGASRVRVFGSVARGEADEKSDVDFLVSLEKGKSLLDLAKLSVELEDLLGIKVDVAPDNALRPGVDENVHREALAL